MRFTIPARGLWATIVVGVLVSLPQAAQAAAPALQPASQVARQGAPVRIQAAAAPGDTCRVAVDGRRAAFAVPQTGRFVLSGRVARRAAPSVHRLTLRCSAGTARARVRVKASRTARRSRGSLFKSTVRIDPREGAAPPTGSPVADPQPALSGATVSVLALSLLQPPTPKPFARPEAPATRAGAAWWAAYGPGIENVFRNGQCTDWVQQKRPDVVRAASLAHFERAGAAAAPLNWDAKYWTRHAQDSGLAVSKHPAVGAVMVYQPGSGGAGTTGHVAIVEVVAPDGSFGISHMNAPDPGRVTLHAYGPAEAAAFARDPGIAFIH